MFDVDSRILNRLNVRTSAQTICCFKNSCVANFKKFLPFSKPHFGFVMHKFLSVEDSIWIKNAVCADFRVRQRSDESRRNNFKTSNSSEHSKTGGEFQAVAKRNLLYS